MTDIILRDVDAVLAERIRRIGETHGWSPADTLLHVLEYGLHACEGDGKGRLDPTERDVLGSAIQALEQVPDDQGFALIGRAGAAPDAPSDGPDQSIRPEFSLE
jgi:hypothetical protein